MASRPTEAQVAAYIEGTACPHWQGYMLDNGSMLVVHKDHGTDLMGSMCCFIEPDGKVTYGVENETN